MNERVLRALPLTRDFRRRHAEHALSMRVRFGRLLGARFEPGGVLPPSLDASPDDVRAASSGRECPEVDIQDMSRQAIVM